MNKEKAFCLASVLVLAVAVLWAVALTTSSSPVPVVPPVPVSDMRADPGVAVPSDLDRQIDPGRPLFERAEAWAPVHLQPLSPPDLPPPPALRWPGEAEGPLAFPHQLGGGGITDLHPSPPASGGGGGAR